MTIIYEVSVEYNGRPFTAVRVAARSPMAACESAERIACKQEHGDLAALRCYFASRVRELTAAEAFPELTPQSA